MSMHALAGVDLRVESGEFLALIGHRARASRP
jgi:ABC-type multidrug transport system ATPase subunit